MAVFRQVYRAFFPAIVRGTFSEKVPRAPLKNLAFTLSAVASGVVTQGGLFGTRPPREPRENQYRENQYTKNYFLMKRLLVQCIS